MSKRKRDAEAYMKFIGLTLTEYEAGDISISEFVKRIKDALNVYSNWYGTTVQEIMNSKY